MSLPANLIFLATMNPEDRSVDEIDAAMERRWAKIELKPDSAKVTDFLTQNGAPNEMIAPVITFFVELQRHIEIGHAFFRTVRDPESLERLWETQLRFVVRKRFRYEPDTIEDVTALWNTCLEGVVQAVSGPAPGPGA